MPRHRVCSNYSGNRTFEYAVESFGDEVMADIRDSEERHNAIMEYYWHLVNTLVIPVFGQHFLEIINHQAAQEFSNGDPFGHWSILTNRGAHLFNIKHLAGVDTLWYLYCRVFTTLGG